MFIYMLTLPKATPPGLKVVPMVVRSVVWWC
jgi:hypothetical protein